MVEVMTSEATAEGNVLQGANMPRFIDVWFKGQILRFDQQMVLTVSTTETSVVFALIRVIHTIS